MTPDRLPRLLVIMGSGETSPTMVKTHRLLLARLGPPPVPAVVLDTPFGFQENADDVTARAITYFRQSVGVEMGVASYRTGAPADALAYETMLTRLREARYVFAGPGSPSYALRTWSPSLVPKVLAEKLESGGCVTFASAAAVTLGVASVPVYEIYKVGEEPRWIPGLDILREAGLVAAVIPHYNNAEGGHHDTRFCYLGERRLRAIEGDLPPGAFVLGVDEHTACVFDLDARTASVTGLGVVTVRSRGRSSEITAGTVVSIAELGDLAATTADGSADGGVAAGRDRASKLEPDPSAAAGQDRTTARGSAVSPLLTAVGALEHAFEQAVVQRDAAGAVRAILELESELVAWSSDTLQSDEVDRARAALRSMVVRLGELADRGTHEPAEVVAPFVDALNELRAEARNARRWAEADAIRDRLAVLGVEVRDAADGSSWRLKP